MKWSLLAEKVHQVLIRNELLKKNDKILLAVSAGVDSIVMLSIFLELQPEWDWDLVIGHINHGLRPDVDESESQLCKKLAKKHQIMYLEEKIDLNDPKIKNDYKNESEQNPSLESLARDVRYKVFTQWAIDHECDAVCTGHHLNDQAETILYRMLTGSGIIGLRGIPEIRDMFIRPLLSISKNEIEKHAKEKHLIYFEDESNVDEKHIRNKIRHSLLPVLKDLGFNDIEHKLSNSAYSLTEAFDALEYYTKKEYDSVVSVANNEIMIQKEGFAKHPLFIKKQILRNVLKEHFSISRHVSENQVQQMIEFILSAKNGTEMDMLGVTILKDRKNIVLPFKNNDIINRSFNCKNTTFIINNAMKLRVEVKNVAPDLKAPNKNTAYFPKKIVGKNIIIRSWEKGDRMNIFGGGREKKISDILKDEKISSYEKQKHPVMIIDGKIVWIPGVKRSNVFTVGNDDVEMVMITYKHEVT
jgi:tRNA(Ile)-lysidine synthase